MENLKNIIGFQKLLEIISGYAESEPGKKHVLSLEPDFKAEKIKKKAGHLAQIIEYQEDIPDLASIRSFEKPELGDIFTSESLVSLGRILRIGEEIREISEELDILQGISSEILEFPEIKNEIFETFDDEGNINKNKFPELRELYKKKENLKKKIDGKIRNILRERGDLLQEEIVTTRSGRTVIPVKYERKEEIEGMVVDLSRTGSTAFVEPSEVVKIDNELSEVEIEIKRKTTEILRNLTGKIRDIFPSIRKNIEILTEIDSMKARAKFAGDFNARISEITEDGTLHLKECRHPILMTRKEVEPLTVDIGRDNRTLLVSGPNAGGKTVLLKTIGIAVFSAYSCIPVPSDYGTKVGNFKNIFGIIEDEQSLEEDLSTFSSYIVRLKEIIENADENSIVLLDELGGNTSPEEGGALAISILNKLKDLGSLIIATTHLSSLKFYVEEQDGMINGAMEYAGAPTYHLQMGIPGGSRAIKVAERIGLSREITDSAKNHLDRSVLKAEELIEELSEKNRTIREKENEVKKLKEEFSHLRDEYHNKMQNVKKEKKEIIKKAKNEAREIIKEARSTVEATIKNIKEQNASKESIREYKENFEDKITEESEKDRETYKPEPEPEGINIDVNVNSDIPLELSVRGLTKEQAWSEVDRYLDRAVLAAYDSVRIVHGKGSWTLRNMLQEKLKNDSRVKGTSTPSRMEGGTGVTVVHLEK